MADVFVSYSRRDKERVTPLIAALTAQGWSVWWDPAITPGQEFDRQIAAELKVASAVLVVWTSNSVESRWVRGEARDGADRGVLVPVRLGDAPLPIDFRAFHTIDLDDTGDAAGSARFQEVVQALGTLINRERELRPVVETSGSAAAAPVAASGPARVAICVLPFTNLSGDAEQQFFSDGITEDIITELSRWRLLSVRSRSASFRYRGNTPEVGRIARELNVRFIVEGSVRRMGDRVRINVQLIDAESGSQVWAERFDRAQAEIFAVQDHVVQTIVSTLVGRVRVSDTERARRKPSVSLEAYECVLKGNALPWNDPASAAEATRLFERAIEIDPEYGLAYALLATMRRAAWRDGPDQSTAALDEALALAKRAVELDDGESTCHSLLAQAYLQQRSFELAVQHMRRSVEINPNNQWNVADMAIILMYTGKAEEAMAWLERATQIDPYFDPPWYWQVAGQTCMVLHRFLDALAMFEHIPVRTYRIAAFMAACHARLADRDRARSSAAECVALRPDFSIRHLLSREPFKNRAESEYFAESLRLAGLPE